MVPTEACREPSSEHDFDGFWKELLDEFLHEFVELFAPDVLVVIDFERAIVSLEKELHELFPEDRSGRRFVDKLFRVALRSGDSAVLLFHVDVQEERDESFPRRMFQYRYRLFDRHDIPIYSIAVLGDRDPSWRPNRFHSTFLDDSVEFRFRIVKLIDWLSRITELERSRNPVAVLVATYLRTKSTGPNRDRLQFKIAYAMLAANLGCDRAKALRLLRLIDWLMRLPDSLRLEFRTTMKEISEANKMPILMDLEIEAMAIGEARGEANGRHAAILTILRARFGTISNELESRISAITEISRLDELIRRGALASDLEAFERASSYPPNP